MEYTISKLAAMAGVSRRTLHYYDEIRLLCPARTNASGYRIYTLHEVNRLQQILFYRELGMDLNQIALLLDAPDFNAQHALETHLQELHNRKMQINTLIHNAQQSLAALKGECIMKDAQKFEGFKKDLVDKNEKQYGQEARAKYGDETMDAANQKMLNLTEEQYAEFNETANQLAEVLKHGVTEGDKDGSLASQAAALHKKWLSFTWPKGQYTPQAHVGLAEMYVADERFKEYYDKITPGAAQFLRDAIVHCIGGTC